MRDPDRSGVTQMHFNWLRHFVSQFRRSDRSHWTHEIKSTFSDKPKKKRDIPAQNSMNYLHFNRGIALDDDAVRTSSCRRDVPGVTASPSLLDTLENFINHGCFLHQRRLLSTNATISRSPTFFSLLLWQLFNQTVPDNSLLMKPRDKSHRTAGYFEIIYSNQSILASHAQRQSSIAQQEVSGEWRDTFTATAMFTYAFLQTLVVTGASSFFSSYFYGLQPVASFWRPYHVQSHLNPLSCPFWRSLWTSASRFHHFCRPECSELLPFKWLKSHLWEQATDISPNRVSQFECKLSEIKWPQYQACTTCDWLTDSGPSARGDNTADGVPAKCRLQCFFSTKKFEKATKTLKNELNNICPKKIRRYAAERLVVCLMSGKLTSNKQEFIQNQIYTTMDTFFLNKPWRMLSAN